MKFWQAITWAETDQLVELARFAEELGFHGLMSGDHAVYPETIAPEYPYSDSGLPPMQPTDEYPDQTAIFAAMAGTQIPDASWLPRLQADVYRFDATWEKETDGVWRLLEASWHPATTEDFG